MILPFESVGIRWNPLESVLNLIRKAVHFALHLWKLKKVYKTSTGEEHQPSSNHQYNESYLMAISHNIGMNCMQKGEY